MNRSVRNAVIALSVAAPFAALPILLKANVAGAEPRYTGAPGDSPAACTECHAGAALNAGAGSVKIVLPGPGTYTPGVKQRIKVQVSDPAQRRWGFQFTARLAGNAANGQAGELSSTDNLTQVVCEDGRPKPCASPSTVQFVTHTLAGTRNGTTESATFEFDWTPPETDAGKVTFYAAGNAANGDTRNSGDRIYTTSAELTYAAASPKPSISAEKGVVNAASLQDGVAPNSWIRISGLNLASVTRTWTAEEIAAGKLPASLEGVSVTVNAKPAYVQYISPTEINALTPADDAVGPVEVRVTSSGQTSDAFVVNLQSLAPAFFTYDGRFAATSPGENSLLDKSGKFFSAPDASKPVKPGDTITLYGTGFGPTDPAFPAGQVPDSIANLTTPLKVTIGEMEAIVVSTTLAPPFPNVYQIKIQVPDAVADGEQPVVAQIGGATSRAVTLTVQR